MINNSFSTSCTYRFIESSISDISERINYNIILRQQPERAKVSLANERDRRPIEPPPILQLYWENITEEELKKCLQSPFYFMVANIVTEEDPQTLLLPAQDYLSGSTVSSLHRLRDIDNSDGGFFVFGDLAVKKEGRFRLQFCLFEILDGVVHNRKTMLSNAFTVYLPKHFPGPVEATFLSRTFSDQGVKMRIRKEHRMQSRKRKNIDETDSQQKKNLKRSGVLISTSPPSYSSMNPSDVFFGRWQATTDKSRQLSISTSSSSMDDHEYRTLTNKFKYQGQAIPSPESTTYTSSSNSMDPSPYSVSHSCLANKQVLPYLSQPERLPTPPNATDHHMSYHWGTRLPPLRTIMNDDYKHSSMTLILPPPSSIIPSYVIEPYSRR